MTLSFISSDHSKIVYIVKIMPANIVIGLVTYKTEDEDLSLWSRSLELAYMQALAHYSDLKVSVVTLDNSERKPQLKIPDIRIHSIFNSSNLGYTAGINKLIRHAMTENLGTHFLSSNPDGAFHPDFFIELLRFQNKFPKAVIECIQFPEEHLKYYDPITFDTDWSSGCCMFVPFWVFDVVGLFDENFFMYVEDVDFSWRCKMLGIDIKTCPTAKYGHLVLNRQPNPTTNKYILESGRYLAIKWNQPAFKQHCEIGLLLSGCIDSIQREYTPLPIPVSETNFKPNFSNNFVFAESRWK